MNLLVGALCEDGVVIGAFDSGGFDPADEPTANTLVVESDLILAGTGRVGLGQRFADVVTEIRSDSRFLDWNGLRIARTIAAQASDDFASTHCDRGQFGALVAFRSSDGPQLCEFAARDLQPELKTPDRRFVAMGPGRSLATHFLKFLDKVLFADSPPSLSEGVFAATWTLEYALGSLAGTGAGATRIAVLAPEAADMPFAARLLSDSERSDRIAEVRGAEAHLAAYRARLSGGDP
jgi:hypothetical protein